jgi:hypothetical protein
MSASKTQLIWEAGQKVTLGKLVPPAPLLEVVIDREQRFQDIWDLSGEVDFSFYSHPDYVYLLLNSWRVRSCTDIELLLREKIINEPKVVIDFHGGMGLTAMRLGMAFPDATVYSHSAVEQHRGWCRDIAADLGLTNVHPIDHLVPADLLIAQETMEHMKDPFKEILEMMETVQPKQYLDGSSFSIPSPGHFSVYTNGGVDVGRDHVKRRFYSYVRSFGFQEYWVARNLKKPFNSRPALFDRVTERVLVPVPYVPTVRPQPVGTTGSKSSLPPSERGLTPDRINAVERWKASGSTKAGFAAQIGVPVSTFKRWVYWVAHNPGYMAPYIEESEEAFEIIPEPVQEFNTEPQVDEGVEEEIVVVPAEEVVSEEAAPAAPAPTLQTVHDSSPEFVIEVAGAGHRVKVPTGFNADELRRLLRALS